VTTFPKVTEAPSAAPAATTNVTPTHAEASEASKRGVYVPYPPTPTEIVTVYLYAVENVNDKAKVKAYVDQQTAAGTVVGTSFEKDMPDGCADAYFCTAEIDGLTPIASVTLSKRALDTASDRNVQAWDRSTLDNVFDGVTFRHHTPSSSTPSGSTTSPYKVRVSWKPHESTPSFIELHYISWPGISYARAKRLRIKSVCLHVVAGAALNPGMLVHTSPNLSGATLKLGPRGITTDSAKRLLWENAPSGLHEVKEGSITTFASDEKPHSIPASAKILHDAKSKAARKVAADATHKAAAKAAHKAAVDAFKVAADAFKVAADATHKAAADAFKADADALLHSITKVADDLSSKTTVTREMMFNAVLDVLDLTASHATSFIKEWVRTWLDLIVEDAAKLITLPQPFPRQKKGGEVPPPSLENAQVLRKIADRLNTQKTAFSAWTWPRLDKLRPILFKIRYGSFQKRRFQKWLNEEGKKKE
jgi:hypothetical protein